MLSYELNQMILDEIQKIHTRENSLRHLAQEINMPKKKAETEPKLVGNGHTTINVQAAPEKESELLVLHSIVDIDGSSKEFPEFTTKDITVRADVIDLIELDKAATRWTSNPMPTNRSIYDYSFLRMYHTYWYPAEWTDCIKIYLAGGQEYKINMTMGDLRERIDRAG